MIPMWTIASSAFIPFQNQIVPRGSPFFTSLIDVEARLIAAYIDI